MSLLFKKNNFAPTIHIYKVIKDLFMKKLYALFALLLMVASANAQAWKTPQHKAKKAPHAISVVKNNVKKAVTLNHEIYDDPTVFEGLVADSTAAWYYGDLAATGTSTFYLFLSTNGISTGGIPNGPGQMVQVMIFADPLEDTNNIVLPTGTFSIVAEDDMQYAAGEVYTGYTSFIDAFYDPDDPTNTEDLFGYQYEPGDEGSVVISKDDDGNYNISVDMNFVLYDTKTYEEVDSKHVTMTYNGAVGYTDKDESKYTPVEDGYEMSIPNASGRYTEDGYGYGNYSIAFYSDGMLDDEGYIVDAGDLLNRTADRTSQTSRLFVAPWHLHRGRFLWRCVRSRPLHQRMLV